MRLDRRRTLARLLLALVEAREQQQGPVPLSELVERLWPGERILERAARARVYAAVRALRRLGLGATVLTRPTGYLLDPTVRLLRDETPAGLLDAMGRVPPLPRPPGPLVGRTSELARLQRAVLGADRYAELVGAPGMGKSRLALALARRLEGDGFAPFLVDVTAARTPHDLLRLVATPLGIPVRNANPYRSLGVALESRAPLLLVLDHAERLPEAVPDFAERLLAETSRVHLLVVAWLPLRAGPAQTVALGPLPLRDAEVLFQEHTEQLGYRLTEEDRLHLPGLLELLECSPLQIELAAGRLGVRSVEELAGRLASGAPVEPAAEPTRPDALHWLWQQLDVPARRALLALSVLPSAFSSETAEALLAAVGAGTPVARAEQLARVGLLHPVETPGRSRRLALVDSVRRLAKERRRDAAWRPVERLAEDALLAHALTRFGNNPEERLASTERPRLLADVFEEEPNIRLAVEVAFARRDERAIARLAEMLMRAWFEEAQILQAADVLEGWLARAEGMPMARAALQWMVGSVCFVSGQPDRAETLFLAALEASEHFADPRDVGPAWLGLASLPMVIRAPSEHDARMTCAWQYARRHGLEMMQCKLYVTESALSMVACDTRRARRALREGLRLARARGWATLELRLRSNGAILAYYLEPRMPSVTSLSSMAEQAARLRIPTLHAMLRTLQGRRLLQAGVQEEARRLLEEARRIWLSIGHVDFRLHHGVDLAREWLDQGEPEQAMRLYEEAFPSGGPTGRSSDLEWCAVLARLFAHEDPDEAIVHLERAEDLLRRDLPTVTSLLAGADAARAALALGLRDRAAALMERALLRIEDTSLHPASLLGRTVKEVCERVTVR